MAAPMIVKKYSNRRLYDTVDSRYITLEELTHKIRAGKDVLVQDASSGADITQVTLTQIILESRGGAKLLPIPLLIQLIRMGDEALAEFFGRYMTWALEIYMRARTQAQAISPYVPLATVPFSATNALARIVMGGSPWSSQRAQAVGVPMPPPQATMDDAPPPYASNGAAQPMYDAPPPPPVAHSVERAPSTTSDDVAAIRRELEALKESLKKGASPKRRSRTK